MPPGSATHADIDALRDELLEYKLVKQTFKKQKPNGSWGANMLGLAPTKSQGVKDAGTVSQYRHLLELGVPVSERAFKLSDRLFFRVLSRDDDPALHFEFQKAAKGNRELALWARDLMREGIAAALAQAGHVEDPRVRGAAHRIVNAVSAFLRSDLAEKPITKKGARNVLNPGANPPTVFSVAMVAFMPSLQRERAGFVERLGSFICKPAPKRTYVIQLGKAVQKPVFHLLGEPLAADSGGNPKDLPFALHWIELLARMNILEASQVGQRIFARLLKDCDESGVWNPKSLRAIPKSPGKLADHAFPLECDGKSPERRKTDVTFRLALIAKLAGITLEFT